MKLAKKIPLTIGAVLLATAGAGLFGIYSLNQSIKTYSTVIEADYAAQDSSRRILVDFKTQVQEWKNILLRGKDGKRLEEHWHTFEKREAEVSREAKKLQAQSTDEEARSLLGKFIEAHVAMGVAYRKGLQDFKAANFDPTVGDFAVKGMDRAPAELLDQVANKIEASTVVAVREASAQSSRATVISLSLMLVVGIFGMVGAWMITRAVTKPLNHALDVAKTVASGDLTSTINAHGNDETGQLLRALGEMQGSLSDIVGQVRSSSDSIATGSAEIAMGNTDLSQRTEMQAGNLQQTAASMEQLSGTVKTTAETSVQANQLATSASAAAVKGGEMMNTVVTTMQEISASSKKISDIIGTIDGIAFQTNILALNAAVEAARAGEQGRGFAVVASEVRSLAQRSAEAAKQIKALIGASVEKVDDGARLVDEAGVSIGEIVSQVKRVSQAISEIAHATTEQSTGISQVGDAVQQLDQVTQQNAALVEESAAAAESLKHQAVKLTEVVGKFRLSGSQLSLG